MPTLPPASRKSALLAAALATSAVTSSAAQQAPLVLKAGTPITLSSSADLDPKAAKPGDTVDFTVAYPVRAGHTAVIARGTIVHGHVMGVKPKVQIALDPLPIAGTTFAFAGNPFDKKGVSHQETPPELAYHYNPTAGEIAEITGVGLVALPIVLPILIIASPFLLASHHGDHMEHAGTHVIVKLAADTSIDAAALPAPEPYTGLPIVYVLDRYRRKNDGLYCGADRLVSGSHSEDVLLRLPAETYAFHTANAKESAATVVAQQDGRYLVFHDKDGLHAVDLSARPDLIEDLPPVAKTKFFVDYQNLEPGQAATLASNREHGGCGVQRLLHARPPRPAAAEQTLTAPATQSP